VARVRPDRTLLSRRSGIPGCACAAERLRPKKAFWQVSKGEWGPILREVMSYETWRRIKYLRRCARTETGNVELSTRLNGDEEDKLQVD